MNKDPSPPADVSALLQAPFQVPAVDRSTTAPARADAAVTGAEANLFPWHLIQPYSKGGMAHITNW
ncbi:hypothetical protein ACIGFK_17105 [Streptomyces sp. NPDC085524]|uniref:hypothetical protein n=1 Tax=unclassified Streptomyces TaxID=2593676 RepID=UPI0035D7E4EE